MSRGARINQRVRRHVFTRAREEPKTDRAKLAKEIQRELLVMHEIPPKTSSLMNMISTARNWKPTVEDAPWHMGIVNDYEKFPHFPRTSEDLAAVMEAHQFAADHKAILTIRQAKWVAPLRPVVKVLYERRWDALERDQLVALSIIWGCSYAHHETWCEVTGDTFDTTELDRQLELDPVRRFYGGMQGSLAQELLNEEAVQILRGLSSTKQGVKEWLLDPFNREMVDLEREFDKKYKTDKEFAEKVNEARKTDSALPGGWDERVRASIFKWIDSRKEQQDKVEEKWRRIREQNPGLNEKVTKIEDALQKLIAAPTKPDNWDRQKALWEEYESLKRSSRCYDEESPKQKKSKKEAK